MYMSGLGDQADIDAAQCIGRGGVPIFRYTHMNADGSPNLATRYYGGCVMPAAPAGNGPVTQITTATTVSPQVSPGFVQQSNPSNSPATVGTRQDTGGSTATPIVSQPIQSPNIEEPPAIITTPAPQQPGTITPAQQDANLWDLFSRMVTGANGGGQQSQPGITYVPSGGGGAPVTITTAGPSASLFTPRWIAALIALALGTAYVLKPSRTRTVRYSRRRKAKRK